MPPRWAVALNALKLANHAQDTSQRSLPLNVRELKCQLLDVPKRFNLPQAGLSPGACVALMDDGRRVNYVLVAHVQGDVWRCSPGAVMQSGRMLLDTVWRPSDCKTKNIVQDAWSGVALKRRMSSHVMVDHLQRLLREHADPFYDLVANEVWRIETQHARTSNQAFDVDAARSCFESNPFVWGNAGGQVGHQCEVYFMWSWECRGELEFSKRFLYILLMYRNTSNLPQRN